MFADLYRVNTPIMVNFKLPMERHGIGKLPTVHGIKKRCAHLALNELLQVAAAATAVTEIFL